MKNLNADLKNGTFQQVYLLTGEEAYLKNRYKKRLRAALVGEDDLMNFTAYTGKGIDIRQVIETAETMPFFAERRLIQIEDSGFFKNACPELAEYLPTMPKETYMVFIEQDIDKRGKLYKAVKAQGRIVELGRQDARTLTTWVLGMIKKEGKNITQDALNLFLEKSGDDMENIANELEKLLCYVQDAPAIERADVEAICTVTTENKIFDMIRCDLCVWSAKGCDRGDEAAAGCGDGELWTGCGESGWRRSYAGTGDGCSRWTWIRVPQLFTGRIDAGDRADLRCGRTGTGIAGCRLCDHG